MSRAGRTTRARLLAAFLVAGMARLGFATPADVVTIPAPILGADPPKAQELHEGDASVATQTGSLDYSYPIAVPPGRLGNQPSLALSYSSQAPLFGGIAAGWSLSIPQIKVDTSTSQLVRHVLDSLGPDPWSHDRFISTMAGSRPLVRVTEPTSAGVYATFRAQNDTSFTRYERMQSGQPFQWRAYATDGTVYYFGDTNLITGTSFSDVVPLTRTVDPFGNTVEYQWDTSFKNDPRIAEIRYTSNPGAGLQPFAKVDFTWAAQAQCPGIETPVGAANDFRAGVQHYFGASKLTQIVVTAVDPSTGAVQHTRQITLGYSAESESCTAKHGPVRLLTSIQESAWGATAPRVDLPPVSLTYGDTANSQTVTSTLTGWHGDSAFTSGLRYPDSRWPTVDSMMLDFDGDGLVDHLRMNGGCNVAWDRNTGNGFVGGGNFTLPTIGWRDPSGPDTNFEGCSLDGQRTLIANVPPAGGCKVGLSSGSYVAYRWLDMNADGLPDLVASIIADPDGYNPDLDPALPWQFSSCSGPTDGDCALPDETCMTAAVSCPAEGVCSTNDSSVHSCLTGAPHAPCARTLSGSVCSGGSGPQQATCSGPQPPSLACGKTHSYEHCGEYPWMIYWNQGGGQLATTADIKYEPIQLESDSGDSPVGGGSIYGASNALLDLDGDGYLDGIQVYHINGLGFWWIFPGDATGQLHAGGPEPDKHWWWFTPPYAAPGGFSDMWPTTLGGGAPCPGYGYAESYSQLTDMNGDGLPDLVWQWRPSGGGPAGPLQVFYNTGSGFQSGSLVNNQFFHGAPSLLSSITQTGVSLFTTAADQQLPVNSINPCWSYGGSRVDVLRMMDVDGDGRQDMFRSSTSELETPQLFFNAGGEMLAPLTAAANEPGVQVGTLTYGGGATPPDWWSHYADFIDLDGDGVQEYATVTSGSSGAPAQITTTKRADIAHPMRLLKAIDNGRGAVTTVAYAAITDHSVVTPSAPPKRSMPHTQWVVKSMTTTDQFASVPSTTSYQYDSPHWSQDDEQRWGFRGFDDVRTTSPRSAVTEDRYDYSVDWSGRLRSTLVFPAETPAAPTSIHETDVIGLTLFNNAITTFHPQVTRAWTCAAGQTEAQCRATPAAFTKSASTWNPQSSTTTTGSSLMYVETARTEQDSEAYNDGDRTTTSGFALDADGSTYRLKQIDSVSQMQVAGTPTTYARSHIDFDPSWRVALRTTTWFDGVVANAATAEKQYDLTTGNVTSSREPEQYAANRSAYTTYSYDPQQRFVAKTTDPLGHIVATTYDSGTGALLRTIGPNGCAPPTLCQANEQAEEKRTDVDGLGRPVATWVAIDSTSTGHYTLAQVSKASYVDSIAGGLPTSVTSQHLIEYDDTRWTSEKVELDGHGRPTRKTTFAQGSAPADAITRYTYDAIGKLTNVMVPDPSVNTGTQVSYDYTFDSVGRARSIRRPGASPSSGTDLAYDGVTETRTEVAGGAGGPAAVTQTIHDPFGRLVIVKEQLDDGTYATTTYSYDGNDNVASITDPEGLVTLLDHDQASRRIAIHRGARTWTFKYDRNGNLTSEAAPPPTQATADILAFTTTYAYDDLDRVHSRTVGSRKMTTADLDLFGAGELDYSYDTGINGLGRLAQVTTHSTTASPHTVLTETLTYDAEGNGASDKRVFTFGTTPGSYTKSATYAPDGKLRLLTYGDGATTSTSSRTFYDNRALPSKMELYRPGYGTQTLAAQTRNVAGLVTRRESIASGTYDIDWTFDSIGRITMLTASKNSSMLARQAFIYFGLDDPSRMTQQYLTGSIPGGLSRTFNYTYDARHQLKTTSEGSGAFTSSYSFKPSGHFDRTTLSAPTAPGSDVRQRDVYYEYNATDPEAVSRLRNASAGTTFASYTYDTAGNLTARTHTSPSASWTFAYDGDDQLRRVTANSGIHEEYYYDHTGARFGIVKRNAQNTVAEVRYFDGGDTELWLSPAGAITESYAYVSLGTPVARVTNRADFNLEVHSPLSNLLLSIDPQASGATTSAFIYGPYAETVQSYQGTGAPSSTCGGIGAVPCHRRRFNDKYVDELDSLSYYGARYYDPISMSWTQADPAYRFSKDAAWNQPRRGNLYDYDAHNPNRFIDPDGRDLAHEVYEMSGICPRDSCDDTSDPVGAIVMAVADTPMSILLTKPVTLKVALNELQQASANNVPPAPPPRGAGMPAHDNGAPAEGQGDPPLSPQATKSIASYEKRIEEHVKKIESELTRAAPDTGLIGHWQKEIDTFRKNIDKVKSGKLNPTPRGTKPREPKPDAPAADKKPPKDKTPQ